eukprot:jgi/Chlat1/8820/Chrsp91S08161
MQVWLRLPPPLVAVFLLLLLVVQVVAGGGDLPQTEGQHAAPHLSSALLHEYAHHTQPRHKLLETQQLHDQETPHETRQVPFFPSGSSHLLLSLHAHPSASLSHLESSLSSLGFNATGRVDGHYSGIMPVENVGKLAEVEGLRHADVTTPVSRGYCGITGRVVTQGDKAMFADLVRNRYGFCGDTISIGVISDSYNTLGGAHNDVLNNDLPASVFLKQELPATSPVKGTDEGRKMMQIIHDVAPMAELTFQTGFVGESAFANAINQLVASEHDIIVDDVGYIEEPWFSDGIVAQAVDRAKASGTLYVTAAGNDAGNSFQANWRQTNIGAYPVFNFGTEDALSGYQQWDDPFKSANAAHVGPQTNLDLYLLKNPPVFNPSATGHVARSIDDNIAGGSPVEKVAVYCPAPFGVSCTNYIVVHRKAGRAPTMMKYMAIYDAGQKGDYVGPAPGTVGFDTSTVYGHTNAAGALSVGAVFWKDTPAYGGTLKPDFFSGLGGMAPDGVATTLDLQFGFSGTSAAAPHVAGVAALMLGSRRYTPGQLITAMQANAESADECRFTPAENPVDPVGCSVPDRCPCAKDFSNSCWGTHSAYVSCVNSMANLYAYRGFITAGEAASYKSSAAGSSCGSTCSSTGTQRPPPPSPPPPSAPPPSVPVPVHGLAIVNGTWWITGLESKLVPFEEKVDVSAEALATVAGVGASDICLILSREIRRGVSTRRRKRSRGCGGSRHRARTRRLLELTSDFTIEHDVEDSLTSEGSSILIPTRHLLQTDSTVTIELTYAIVVAAESAPDVRNKLINAAAGNGAGLVQALLSNGVVAQTSSLPDGGPKIIYEAGGIRPATKFFWSVLPVTLPVVKLNAGYAAYGTEMLFFGGTGTPTTAFTHDRIEGGFSVANLLTGAVLPAATNNGEGVVFLTGGLASTSLSVLANVQALSVDANTWKAYPNMLTPRYGHATFVVNALPCVVGGDNVVGAVTGGIVNVDFVVRGRNTATVPKLTVDCMQQNPTTLAYSWKVVTSPGVPYFEGASVMIGGYVYLFTANPGDRTAYKYNINAGTFASIPTMPTQRLGAAAAAYGYRVWVAGGVTLEEHILSNVVEEFDAVTNTWRGRIPSLKVPRAYFALVASAATLYAYGGVPTAANSLAVRYYGYGTDAIGFYSDSTMQTGDSGAVFGNNRWIDLGNPTKLNFDGPVSFAAWVQPSTFFLSRTSTNEAHPWHCIIDKSEINQNSRTASEVTLRAKNADVLNGGPRWQSGSSYQKDSSRLFVASTNNYAVDVNKWVHLVGTWDLTNGWRVYRNATLVASAYGSVGNVAKFVSAAGWSIGARGGYTTGAVSSFWQGKIRDVRVYKGTLSATDVGNLFRATQTPAGISACAA